MSKHIHIVGNYRLNDAELDVFEKLFMDVELEDGDLPSKAGMLGLMKKGLSERTGELKRNRLTKQGRRIGHKYFLW